MKKINYRGGLVTFDIPNGWLEEYDPNGGGAFYEDNPESGTLRLNVMTLKPPTTNSDINDALIIKAHHENVNKIIIDSNNVIASYKEKFIENGTTLLIYSFQYAHKTSDEDILLAIFSWTIEEKFQNVAKYQSELKILENSIKSMTFGR